MKTFTKGKQNMKSVDLIASGYEWTCPKCYKLNLEIEIPRGTIICRETWKERQRNNWSKNLAGCGRKFGVNPAEHAYE